ASPLRPRLLAVAIMRYFPVSTTVTRSGDDKGRHDRPEPHSRKCPAQVRGEVFRPSVVMPYAGNVPVEFPSEGLPADRGDRRGNVSVLRRGLLSPQRLRVTPTCI